MARTVAPLLPDAQDRLAQLGERLRLARRRRKLSAAMVAERAGMSRVTLAAVEKGMPGVTIGSYLSVMQVLGLDAGLDRVAAEDPLGRELQDVALQPGGRRRSANATSSGPRRTAVTLMPERIAKSAVAKGAVAKGVAAAVVESKAGEGLGLASSLRERAKAKLADKAKGKA